MLARTRHAALRARRCLMPISRAAGALILRAIYAYEHLRRQDAAYDVAMPAAYERVEAFYAHYCADVAALMLLLRRDAVMFMREAF